MKKYSVQSGKSIPTKEQYSQQYKYKQIVKAKMFIDMSFSDPINMNQMADRAHFSKFHFARLFKGIYQITPNQYLTAVRMGHAGILLKEDNSVREVCFLVGFNSVSTFKALFKRQTNSTPSAYKKRQLNLQSSMNKNPIIHLPHCLTKKRVALKKSNIQDH
ncbi:MAG TPA: AraC family transcriptional regulator [Cyclobacteriaceae bacterium]